MTLRFWHYFGDRGWVRIPLSDAHPSVEVVVGGVHEEGFDVTRHLFYLDPDDCGLAIVLVEDRDARDCDGPLSSTTVAIARVEEGRIREKAWAPSPSGRAPAWETIAGRQRDRYAEAMGY